MNDKYCHGSGRQEINGCNGKQIAMVRLLNESDPMAVWTSTNNKRVSYNEKKGNKYF